MRIPPEKLEEFKAIYKKEFGKDLTDAEALEKGTRVLRLMELIYKPMTKADYEETQKRLAELRAKGSGS
jgi:hypothetical protein